MLFQSVLNFIYSIMKWMNENFQPIVGLLLALIIVLLILALLLTLFLARFCCCCARRIKDEDDIYQVGTARGSKMMEPILVATPAHERIYATQSDAIYSTPYSGNLFLKSWKLYQKYSILWIFDHILPVCPSICPFVPHKFAKMFFYYYLSRFQI